jgi:hypothetical protein
MEEALEGGRGPSRAVAPLERERVQLQKKTEGGRQPIFGCHIFLTRHRLQLGCLVYTPPADVSRNLYLSPNIKNKLLPVQDMKAYEGRIGWRRYSPTHS